MKITCAETDKDMDLAETLEYHGVLAVEVADHLAKTEQEIDGEPTAVSVLMAHMARVAATGHAAKTRDKKAVAAFGAALRDLKTDITTIQAMLIEESTKEVRQALGEALRKLVGKFEPCKCPDLLNVGGRIDPCKHPSLYMAPFDPSESVIRILRDNPGASAVVTHEEITTTYGEDGKVVDVRRDFVRETITPTIQENPNA